MTSEKITQAIQLIKVGNKKAALSILTEYLKSNPNDENGWSWLYVCAPSNDEKILCLKQVIRINPRHEKAQSALARLDNKEIPPSKNNIPSDSVENNKKFETQISTNNNSTINKTITGSGPHTIEFIPAICPKCGGELRVPKSMDVVKCMYCGADILIHDPSEIKFSPYVDIPKYAELTERAINAKNYKEAYEYTSKILEYEPDNRLALLKKGYCAGMITTLDDYRTQEMADYISMGVGIKYLNNSFTNDGNTQRRLEPLSEISTRKLLSKYFADVGKHLDDLSDLLKTNDSYMPGYEIIVHDVLSCLLQEYSFGLEGFPSIMATNHVQRIKATLLWYLSAYAVIHPSKLAWKGASYDIEVLLISYGLNSNKELMDAVEEYRNPKTSIIDNCYIATATMGERNHPYVILLQNYRDKILMKTNYGRLFVFCYYKISPYLAAIISNNAFLRRISYKLLVHPMYLVARRTMASTRVKNEECTDNR